MTTPSNPHSLQSLDEAQLQALQDTIKALQDEQEIHHNQLNKMNEENMQKDLHLKVCINTLTHPV